MDPLKFHILCISGMECSSMSSSLQFWYAWHTDTAIQEVRHIIVSKTKTKTKQKNKTKKKNAGIYGKRDPPEYQRLVLSGMFETHPYFTGTSN